MKKLVKKKENIKKENRTNPELEKLGDCDCDIKSTLKDGNFDRTLLLNLMKGFLKTIILWMITKGRIHGYEIIKKMKEDGVSENSLEFSGPGPNKIYPILHELENKGLIKGDWELQGKRKVKYYEATEKGINTIELIKNKPNKNLPPIISEFWKDVMANKEQ